MATAFLACMAVMSLGLGLVSACTFANGYENFEYQIAPQGYALREGEMKAGEQATFAISGGDVDVFVFTEQQYYSYVNLNQYEPGWNGLAVHKELGVSSTHFILTAPAQGNYYLVIDNTVAGSDPGMANKTISMDAIYPFSPIENSPPWPFLPVVLGGIVLFTFLVLAVYVKE
ncbi:MAG TPA: hypothetical protein VLU38_06290 [Methanomassiliicoccales archaeon]|nr:hypothetical protein [Methanomassiliicoccales archaeon]